MTRTWTIIVVAVVGRGVIFSRFRLLPAAVNEHWLMPMIYCIQQNILRNANI